MTKAVYNREKLSLVIDGHAGAGVIGSDIVCAAISVLSFTLAEAVKEIEENTSALHLNIYTEDNGGYMSISCDPDCGHIEDCRIVFDTIAKGFDLIYEYFPGHLKFVRE